MGSGAAGKAVAGTLATSLCRTAREQKRVTPGLVMTWPPMCSQPSVPFEILLALAMPARARTSSKGASGDRVVVGSGGGALSPLEVLPNAVHEARRPFGHNARKVAAGELPPLPPVGEHVANGEGGFLL